MRFVLGFLAGGLGMLAGWFGLAMLIIALEGPDKDGGLAMGAFFEIGPLGGLVGFIVGVWLFARMGLVRAPVADATPARTRVSRPVAVGILAVVAGLAWWGWYELIRSPYLDREMTLDLEFRLAAGTVLPAEVNDVRVGVMSGNQGEIVTFGEAWRAHDGDRPVILARAAVMYKAWSRMVFLDLPGTDEQIWQLDLANQPEPTAGFGEWRRSAKGSVEMNYQVRADP